MCEIWASLDRKLRVIIVTSRRFRSIMTLSDPRSLGGRVSLLELQIFDREFRSLIASFNLWSRGLPKYPRVASIFDFWSSLDPGFNLCANSRVGSIFDLELRKSRLLTRVDLSLTCVNLLTRTDLLLTCLNIFSDPCKLILRSAVTLFWPTLTFFWPAWTCILTCADPSLPSRKVILRPARTYF